MSETPQHGSFPPPGSGAPQHGGFPPPGSGAPRHGGFPPPGSGAIQHGSFPPPGPGAASGPPPGSPPALPGPPGWHRLPPEQLARLHQPGVVPLRPLTLGDVFSGALQTLRRNPEATIGTGLVVLATLLVPSLVISLLLTRWLTTVAPTDLQLLTTGVSALSAMLASVALTGMIVHVVGEAVLGDRARLADTWRATRGRLPALLGNLVLLILLLLAFVVLGVLAVVALVAVADAGGVTWLAVVLGILLVLGMVVVLTWAGCRLSLAPAAVVLERMGPLRSLGRAWSLTRGGQGWRVTGITLLAGLVANIFTAMVQTPVIFAAMLLLDPTGLVDSPVSPALLVLDHLTQLVVNTLVIPFTAGVAALLYLDQRMRREGLDVVLVRAAQDRAATRSG
ncbi:hypothetical protein [Ornithinimicrobium flavum]|uniref:hypothetical protein n=1 Tax=Ornithinimicrobium flavum TaxID=1288636 RepID=UPI00106FB98D|nr:hypothetical protein [Ornithinimicrobium flavum]